METLKWISIYLGIIIVIFCLVFSFSKIFNEGYVIYANKEYDNFEKLNYKLEKEEIRYMKQETIKSFLDKNNLVIPKDSIIQKVICTKISSLEYTIKISYIYNNELYVFSKIVNYDVANYIINNGYQYKGNTIDKIKISTLVISIYAIIEFIIIKICKKKEKLQQ